jgi:radical SAM family uncharacterized protein/radical SAM-linked protein
VNALHKDPFAAEVRVCFAFPDVYEIGISHLGLKILYSIINRLDYAMADRTYLPWLDGLKQMREKQIPLYALESKLAVAEFDLLGITLQSELTFTNVLELIDISGIPVFSALRTDDHPIVIAGGPCASNPLPLSPFIDAFLIGEGEEAILEIVHAIRTNSDRDSRLIALSKLPGVYVPPIHDALLSSDPDFRIDIRKYQDFYKHENLHAPQLMPWQLATHNRYVAEIMRGCTRGCRFCHAGYFYRPVRERQPEEIIASMLQEIEAYGWEEAGLISLSSSDYTCIKPLLEALLARVNQDKTHVSLPSLRVDSLDDQLVTLLKHVGREGLTIAPEAGSQRLRNVINKNLSEAEILKGVRIAKELGWQRIKLYFMIGLPTETEADIRGIIDLIQTILGETGKKFQINVTLSPFVPKPHTPFQWSPMLNAEELLRRALLVKHAFGRLKFIKIKYHTIENSLLEAVISRGDRRTAEWIYSAWKQGAVYDGWNESFRWSYWTLAAEQIGYDYQLPLQSLSEHAPLAWDFIGLGVSPQWLWDEWQSALQEAITEDCRQGCTRCGVCSDQIEMHLIEPENKEFLAETLPVKEKPHPGTSSTFIPSWHYRLFYTKGGDFRYIGHLDWMRMVFRLLGRCKLDIVFTQGFNPHPKVSFGPALAVGVTGDQEYLDFHTSRAYTEPEIRAQLNRFFSHGLAICSLAELSDAERDWIPVYDEVLVIIPEAYHQETELRLGEFHSRTEYSYTITKKDKIRQYDLKQVVSHLEYNKPRLKIIKKLECPNIFELLGEILNIPRNTILDWEITRKGFDPAAV